MDMLAPRAMRLARAKLSLATRMDQLNSFQRNRFQNAQRLNCAVMTAAFADKIQMQNMLFAELSNMFGREVPLYDKSLLVNKICNQTVCELLSKIHVGFSMSGGQLDKTSGERH